MATVKVVMDAGRDLVRVLDADGYQISESDIPLVHVTKRGKRVASFSYWAYVELEEDKAPPQYQTTDLTYEKPHAARAA
jgi:hypothetical protein